MTQADKIRTRIGQSGLKSDLFTRPIDNKLMSRMCILGVMLTLLVSASDGVAQSEIANPEPKIWIDYASFAYSEDESLIEIYVAASAHSLTLIASDSNYIALLPLHLKLFHSSDATLGQAIDDTVWSQKTELRFMIQDTTSFIEGQTFLHQLRLTAVPGEYELHVDATASNLENIWVSQALSIPDYSQTDMCSISDVTLASRMLRSSNRDDPFYKNGLSIFPNVTQLYGEGASELFYYAEAYHTGCAASDAGEYTLLIYVSDANRPTVISNLRKRTQRSIRQTDVLVGSFDLSSLTSGTYALRMVILDSTKEVIVEQSRKFFVYTPSLDASLVALPSEDVETFDTSEYADMPEEEVEKALKYIRLIVTDQEIRRIRRVRDLDERRRLLMDLWRVRDPTPRTKVNEFRDEFYDLLLYANERYSVQRIEGWETDRGNILLRFGRPTEIESHLYARSLKPHEIWRYNNIPGEGQSEFVFADLNGFGEFELIHSTVAGEQKLANWVNEIANTF